MSDDSPPPRPSDRLAAVGWWILFGPVILGCSIALTSILAEIVRRPEQFLADPLQLLMAVAFVGAILAGSIAFMRRTIFAAALDDAGDDEDDEENEELFDGAWRDEQGHYPAATDDDVDERNDR